MRLRRPRRMYKCDSPGCIWPIQIGSGFTLRQKSNPDRLTLGFLNLIWRRNAMHLHWIVKNTFFFKQLLKRNGDLNLVCNSFSIILPWCVYTAAKSQSGSDLDSTWFDPVHFIQVWFRPPPPPHSSVLTENLHGLLRGSHCSISCGPRGRSDRTHLATVRFLAPCVCSFSSKALPRRLWRLSAKTNVSVKDVSCAETQKQNEDWKKVLKWHNNSGNSWVHTGGLA